VQGAKYPSIEAVKDVVKLWAISLRKKFRVVKSSSKEYEVKCVNGDCTWRVHAYKGKYKTHWECSIVTPHTCRLTAVAQTHRNITSTFVAKKMYVVILDKIDYEPKLITSSALFFLWFMYCGRSVVALIPVHLLSLCSIHPLGLC